MPEWKAEIVEEQANLQRAYKIVKELEKAANSSDDGDDSDDVVDAETEVIGEEKTELLEMTAADFMKAAIQNAIQAADDCGRSDLVEALNQVLGQV